MFTSIKRPCMKAPSLWLVWTSPECLLVTSQVRHILSSGSSFFLAVLCMIAVRKDWGLKKPGSHTEEGRLKSEVQPSLHYNYRYHLLISVDILNIQLTAPLSSIEGLRTKRIIHSVNHKLFLSRLEEPDRRVQSKVL